MRGLNKVQLIGNLGRDPEVRVFESNVSVASFTIATTESSRRGDERVDVTEWHNITVWRGLAEVAEKYLKKGDPVYIEGRLRTRQWTDKENNKRYTTEIVATNLIMLGGRRDGAAAPAPTDNQAQADTAQATPPVAQNQTAPAADEAFEDDGSDLPF